MSLSDHAISAYMTPALEVARIDTRLVDVERRLSLLRVSAMPVVDGAGALIGVVSRFDLLHHRRLHPGRSGATCAEVMTRDPVTAAPGAPLRDAGALMLAHRIHRVFVVDGGRLAGVLTTTDLTRAVETSAIGRPLAGIMSAPVATVRVDHRLALAIEWLDRARVTGLVVTDNEWPVGVFAQEDALAARDLPGDTEIRELYDPSLICLPRDTPIDRAAGLAVRMGVRRIVVSHQRDFVGIVTGLDFAGVVAAEQLQAAS